MSRLDTAPASHSPPTWRELPACGQGANSGRQEGGGSKQSSSHVCAATSLVTKPNPACVCVCVFVWNMHFDFSTLTTEVIFAQSFL